MKYRCNSCFILKDLYYYENFFHRTKNIVNRNNKYFENLKNNIQGRKIDNLKMEEKIKSVNKYNTQFKNLKKSIGERKIGKFEKLDIDNFIDKSHKHTYSQLILELHTMDLFGRYYKLIHEILETSENFVVIRNHLNKIINNELENEIDINKKRIDLITDILEIISKNKFDKNLNIPLITQIIHSISKIPGINDYVTTYRYTPHDPYLIANLNTNEINKEFCFNITPLSTSKYVFNMWSKKYFKEEKNEKQYVFQLDHLSFNPTAKLDFITNSRKNEYEIIISPFCLFEFKDKKINKKTNTEYLIYNFTRKYYRRHECIKHSIERSREDGDLEKQNELYNHVKRLYKWYYLKHNLEEI